MNFIIIEQVMQSGQPKQKSWIDYILIQKNLLLTNQTKTYVRKADRVCE